MNEKQETKSSNQRTKQTAKKEQYPSEHITATPHLQSLLAHSLNGNASAVLQLQRLVGNRITSRLLSSTIQRGNKNSSDKKKKATDPFANLPTDAIAIHSSGVYITAPGGLDGILSGKNFLAFRANGESCGDIYLMGALQIEDCIRYFQINNQLDEGIKGASYIVAWYFCRYTSKKFFEVASVGNPELARRCEGLGMEERQGQTFRGECQSVYEAARKKLLGNGWILKGE